MYVMRGLKEAIITMRRCKLQVLGLYYRVELHLVQVNVLADLCNVLQRVDVHGLGLSLNNWTLKNEGHGRLPFLQPIARLTGLEVLALPQWEQLVGQKTLALVPLRSLDDLRVWVAKKTKLCTAAAAAVAAGIKFLRADCGRFFGGWLV